MKKLIFAISVLSALAIFQSSCNRAEANNQDSNPTKDNCLSDSLMQMIKIDSAKNEKIADLLQLSGEVTFDQDKVLRVMPLTSGQVIDVKVELGKYVSAGQTLAIMRSSEVAGNFHERSSAESDLATAQKNMENTQTLWKNGLGTERDYIQAKNEYDKAKSEISKINSVMSVYGSHQSANGTIEIKAPISGYIVEKKVNPGQMVRPDNADNMFTISNLSDIWVLANVYETDISRVHEGYDVEVRTLAYPDKVFTGKIEQLNRILDPDSKVMKARIRLNNTEGLLRPEMFTQVTVKNTEGVSAIAIPTKAVLMDNGKNFVVTFVDKCHYDIRPIELIKTVGDRAYIKSGLQMGEKIVSDNEILLFQQLKGD